MADSSGFDGDRQGGERYGGGRARARALARPTPAGAVWPTLFGQGHAVGLFPALADALRTEIDNRRAFLWLPVAFGIGIALYFGADHEPHLLAGLAATLVLLALCVIAREHAAVFYLFAALATVAAGFAVSSLQVARMAHPVLSVPLTAVPVSGFVERAERRAQGGRIVLLVTGMERTGGDTGIETPRRVRLSTGGALPEVGSHVTVRATLGPPPGPAYPGGYDFGRDAWFDGIGATGFALGRPALGAAPGSAPWSLRLSAGLDELRRAMAARIRAVLPGEAGGIAVALVTGSRDAVSERVEESMRVSGLTHVLSISGLHMALVATGMFFLARALLALSPSLALRHPIKAWAALPAIVGATFYLLLSGAEIATQRSYVMALLVLAGVLMGRPALTLHTLAIAALVVLALFPAALLDPGTQMSFAATLALVAAHERFGRRWLSGIGGSAGPRLPNRLARYTVALVVTSLAAGLATAPYAAFHFQRLAPLSLIANLAAAPLVSFVIMPSGLLGALLIPFGWDGFAWQVMGWGIDGMTRISDWVAQVPGADRGIRAFPQSTLMLFSLGLVGLCLLRTRLVVLVPLLVMAGLWLALRAPMPDLMVDPQGRTVAVRGPDGRLALMGDREPATLAKRFAAGQWLAADGERPMTDALQTAGKVSPTTSGPTKTPHATNPAPTPAGARCDRLGCTLRMADGSLVAYSRQRESLVDDCRLASVLVTSADPPAGCAAQIIRIDAKNQTGAIAGYRVADGALDIRPARETGRERPWLPKTAHAAKAPIAPSLPDPETMPDSHALPLFPAEANQ